MGLFGVGFKVVVCLNGEEIGCVFIWKDVFLVFLYVVVFMLEMCVIVIYYVVKEVFELVEIVCVGVLFWS